MLWQSKGRHQKKNQVFFGVFPKGGGGLAESKISLAEKTEIFLDFFWQKGGKGGGLTYSNLYSVPFSHLEHSVSVNDNMTNSCAASTQY